MQKATRDNDDIHREHHQEELDTDAKAKAKGKAATEQLEKKPRKLSVFMSRASSSRVAPAEGDGGSFSRLSSSRQSTGYRGTTFWRKKKPAQETRRRSAFDRLTRRTSSATNRRRGSMVGDKIKAASDVASRRLHLMKRRMSFNAGLPGERYADTATYDPSQLLEELKLLLEHENLLLADLEQEELPEIMRRDRDFGLSHEGGSSTLDANQFELWRGRIASYVRTFVLMRELHLDQASTSIEAEGEHDLADSILQILQRCGNVKDITLHDCTLSNTTLTSICQLMRARLRSLDLHGTRGFDDVGLKALAAYCSKVRS